MINLELPSMSYTLMFSADGAPFFDGETYTNLDSARDIAFEVSLETGLEVAICQEFGASQNVIETVLA